ncbi:MAG TPA: hypothetical protein VF552_07525 [Allosphingosinicella sp.]
MNARNPIDLFEAICTPADDLDRVRRAAAAEGWEEFVPDGRGPIGSLLRMGRAAAADRRVRFDVLRPAGGGEELVLIIVRVEIERSWANGCRLYGTEMGAAPSQGEIVKRIGREPTRFSEEQGAPTFTWEPGWSAADDSLELILAPPESEAAYVTGFSGWALIGQAVSTPLRES